MSSKVALWARWTVATAAGMLLGALPRAFLGRELVWLPPGIQPLALAVMGTWMGACIGTAQWWVLRPVLAHARRWVPATAAGWALGSMLGAGALGWGAGVGAMLSGILQWRVLRGHVSSADLWLLAVAVDAMVGLSLPIVVLRPLAPGLSGVGAVVGSLSYAVVRGVVAGGVTGVGLVFLQRSGDRTFPLAKLALGCGAAAWVWSIGGFGLDHLWPGTLGPVNSWFGAVPLALVAIIGGCTEIAWVRRGESKPSLRPPALGALLLGASYLLAVTGLFFLFLASFPG